MTISEDRVLLVAVDPSKMVVYSAQKLQILSEARSFEQDLSSLFQSQDQITEFIKGYNRPRVLYFGLKTLTQNEQEELEESDQGMELVEGPPQIQPKEYSLVLEFTNQLILEYQLKFDQKLESGGNELKLSIELTSAQNLNKDCSKEIIEGANSLKQALELKEKTKTKKEAKFFRKFGQTFDDEEDNYKLIELRSCWILIKNFRTSTNPHSSRISIISKIDHHNPVFDERIQKITNYTSCLFFDFAELVMEEKGVDLTRTRFWLVLGTAKDLLSVQLELGSRISETRKRVYGLKLLSKQVRTFNILTNDPSNLAQKLKFVDLSVKGVEGLKLFILNSKTIKTTTQEQGEDGDQEFWSPPISYIFIGRKIDQEDAEHTRHATRLLESTEIITLSDLEKSKLIHQAVVVDRGKGMVLSATEDFMEAHANVINIDVTGNMRDDELPEVESRQAMIVQMYNNPIESDYGTNDEVYSGDDSAERKYVDFDQLREDDIREKTEKRKEKFSRVLEQFSESLLLGEK